MISKLDNFDWMADKGETSIRDGVFTSSVKPLDILNEPRCATLTKLDLCLNLN